MNETSRHPWKRLLRVATIAAVALCLGGLLVWGFVTGRLETGSEAEREKPIKAPSRVNTENGLTVLTIDSAAQQRGGIATAPPQPVTVPPEVHAYGTVLDLGRLMELRNGIVTAKAQVDAEKAKLTAAQKEFERATKLYRDEQNVSAAQMQAAEAAFLADHATLAAAQSQLETLSSTARQIWGQVLGQDLISGSDQVTRLIARQSFLLQITLPPGIAVLEAPARASLRLPDGRTVPIDLISPATKVDPKIQGLSFLYRAPAEPGLLPGLDVEARLPLRAAPSSAVVIPPAAIVWLDGEAWFYLRRGPQTFVRQPAGAPAPEGGFLVRSLGKDTEIVTRGAQALLSEEFRAQIQAGD
jgi:hypothetical protein